MLADFNIGEFSEKSPIANINSSPINRLVRYMLTTPSHAHNCTHFILAVFFMVYSSHYVLLVACTCICVSSVIV